MYIPVLIFFFFNFCLSSVSTVNFIFICERRGARGIVLMSDASLICKQTTRGKRATSGVPGRTGFQATGEYSHLMSSVTQRLRKNRRAQGEVFTCGVWTSTRAPLSVSPAPSMSRPLSTSPTSNMLLPLSIGLVPSMPLPLRANPVQHTLSALPVSSSRQASCFRPGLLLLSYKKQFSQRKLSSLLVPMCSPSKTVIIIPPGNGEQPSIHSPRVPNMDNDAAASWRQSCIAGFLEPCI